MAKSKRKIEQIKNVSRETSNIWMLYLIVFDLFNWTLPDEIRKEFIEWQLLKFGYVAIWIDRESIIVDLLPHLILTATASQKMVPACNVLRGGVISLIRHLEKIVLLFITTIFEPLTYGLDFSLTC